MNVCKRILFLDVFSITFSWHVSNLSVYHYSRLLGFLGQTFKSRWMRVLEFVLSLWIHIINNGENLFDSPSSKFWNLSEKPYDLLPQADSSFTFFLIRLY